MVSTFCSVDGGLFLRLVVWFRQSGKKLNRPNVDGRRLSLDTVVAP